MYEISLHTGHFQQTTRLVSKTVIRASGSEVQILSPPLNNAGRLEKALRSWVRRFRRHNLQSVGVHRRPSWPIDLRVGWRTNGERRRNPTDAVPRPGSWAGFIVTVGALLASIFGGTACQWGRPVAAIFPARRASHLNILRALQYE